MILNINYLTQFILLESNSDDVDDVKVKYRSVWQTGSARWQQRMRDRFDGRQHTESTHVYRRDRESRT